jgi:hypothetical protein
MSEAFPYEPRRAEIGDPYELRGLRPEVLEEWDRFVIVDVIHDGIRVPPALEPLFTSDGEVRNDVRDAYLRERDWGASAVAERLAYHLGLRGYQHVQAARVTSDYNRFRGWSVPEAGHLGRRALFPPASDLLSPEYGELALQASFDPVSQALYRRAEEAFGDGPVRDSRLTRITVHTYDDRAGDGHRRPKTSLIFTPFEYHEFSRLPASIYAPVFPDRLAEFTADRALAYRMALLLEKNYLPVAVNSPYFLPLGGAEMRLQVWCYMKHLEQVVEAHASDALVERFAPLWPLLRTVDEPWIGRDIPEEQLARVDELCVWVHENKDEALQRYRYSAFRPNAIEVEVRKDIVYEGAWRILDDGHEAFVPDPDGMQFDEIDRVAAVMAEGIRAYLTIDQPQKRAGAIKV